MAGDEQAMLDFSEVLLRVNRKFDIIQTKWADDSNFEIKFRTQIPRNNQDFNGLCDEWVDLFSEVTNTVWVKKISNTGPKIKFRKQYQCWTQGGKTVQKELLFDARRCRATLDMKVLTDNPQTRKKNKHIKLGLNVVVKMNFTHLHRTTITDRYAFFVHECEPQPEPPKPVVHNNEQLPNLVAKMVQKGLDFTAKASNTHNRPQPPPPPLPSPPPPPLQPIVSATRPPNEMVRQIHTQSQPVPSSLQQPPPPPLLQHPHQRIDGHELMQNQTLIAQHQNTLEIGNLEPAIQLNQLVPLHNMENIKLEVPQFQPITQLLVSETDMGEPILFCQPTIMLDPSQVIPVSSHSFPSHFVQLHSPNLTNQQGQYL